jgi:hypothetical protein
MPKSVFDSSVVPLKLKAVPIPLGAAPPSGGGLQFTMQHQQQTQWCWAAVTSSVAAYYQNPGWSQCRVVNDRLGQTACCVSGASPTCNRPWYLDQALDRVGELGNYIASPLTLGQLRSEIDAGHPVGVRIGWSNGGGHFVAIGGYSGAEIVDVQDPWFGQSSVDYFVFRTNYQGSGRWTHSYRTRPNSNSGSSDSNTSNSNTSSNSNSTSSKRGNNVYTTCNTSS